MTILQINNEHRTIGGSDIVAEYTTSILREKGHNVFCFISKSSEIGNSLSGKARAFLQGIYSQSAVAKITELILTNKPDIVHIHEVYPLISPWILPVCKKYHIPIVMTCHDYRLSCPIAVHLRNGSICNRCHGGHEYWCFLLNCRKSLFESLAYSLRSFIASRYRLFIDNVTLFIALTEFAKRRLLEMGIKEERIIIIPNTAPTVDSPIDSSRGEYAAYIGRISPEKGISTLVEAARISGVPVKIAGDYSMMSELVAKSPSNVQFVGNIAHDQIFHFYQKARYVVVPSEWYEMCTLVILEAMGQGLPVIASDIGGLSELVKNEETGLLFRPKDVEQLAVQIRYLWERPDLCRKLG
jgi:glycosyltransferase involved in cell wall biosynthesis